MGEGIKERGEGGGLPFEGIKEVVWVRHGGKENLLLEPSYGRSTKHPKKKGKKKLVKKKKRRRKQ